MRKALSSYKFAGQLRSNLMHSGLQGVVNLVCMFWAYRVLLSAVGTEVMGLWALVFSGIAIIRVADLTGAGGLAKFVAEARAKGSSPVEHIHTTVISTTVLFALLAMVAYVASKPLAKAFIEPRLQDQANLLIPIAIVYGLLTSPLAVTLASAIDGIQRADLRARLNVASYVVLLIMVKIFVPTYGVIAWGLSLILQQITVIVGAWFILRRCIPLVGVIPNRWSKSIFFDVVSYSCKLQLNNLASAMSEPVAKLLMSKFGGLESVALYELTLRLVMGLRGLAVQSASPLVAEFAMCAKNAARAKDLLQKTHKLVLFAASAFAIVILPAAPIFSVFTLGRINHDLLLMIAIVSAGTVVNVLAIPKYFLGIGLNYMKWNVCSQFVIAACTMAIGGVLGNHFGQFGIVVAVSIGYSLGAMVVIIGNTKFVARMN